MVNDAITLLSDTDLWEIASVQDAIDLIRGKIQEVIANNQTRAAASDTTEQERIRAVAASLDGKWVKETVSTKKVFL